ncbi:MAG: hypothetical protein WCI51_01730 [Lentisphaerota bacterium]
MNAHNQFDINAAFGNYGNAGTGCAATNKVKDHICIAIIAAILFILVTHWEIILTVIAWSVLGTIVLGWLAIICWALRKEITGFVMRVVTQCAALWGKLCSFIGGRCCRKTWFSGWRGGNSKKIMNFYK